MAKVEQIESDNAWQSEDYDRNSAGGSQTARGQDPMYRPPSSGKLRDPRAK